MPFCLRLAACVCVCVCVCVFPCILAFLSPWHFINISMPLTLIMHAYQTCAQQVWLHRLVILDRTSDKDGKLGWLRDISPSQGLLQYVIWSTRTSVPTLVLQIADWRSPWEGETSLHHPNFLSLSDVLKQVFSSSEPNSLQPFELCIILLPPSSSLPFLFPSFPQNGT